MWYKYVLLTRYFTTKNDKKREANIPEPTGVESFKDIRYMKGYGKWHKLDVFRPAGVKGLLPLIVEVHGGGWVYGDKELYHKYAMDLSKRGFAVISFNYLLAPRGKFPKPLEELDRVLSWAKDHADEYGFDVASLFLVGDSAGAQMSAQYGAIATDPDYAKLFPSLTLPLKITGLGLNCGPYSPLGAAFFDMSKAPKGLIKSEESMWRAYLGKAPWDDQRYALLPYITPAFPPCYVLTGEEDFIKAQNPQLVEKLQQEKVPFFFKEYTSEEGHKLFHVFHVTINEKHAILANDEECAFFKKLLQKPLPLAK